MVLKAAFLYIKTMWRKLLGVLFLLAGIGLYIFSDYIADQVTLGKERLLQGQKTVNEIREVSKLSPYTKDAGHLIAKQGQKKIAAGKKEIAYYTDLSNKIHLGGIICILAGVALIGLGFIKRNHHP